MIKIVLPFIIIGAFLLRVLPQWQHVFVGSNVWFRGMDSWYHMRLADVTNFPNWQKWDYLAQYPVGAATGYLPLLAWISVNDTVAAFLPPVIGSLTLIFVYLIGKNLFSKSVGIIATLLMTVIPGEFLHRTLLGFADHHVLETFFMTLCIYLLVRARKSWKWSIPLGVSVGLYALTWAGLAFFLFIVILWIWWECLTALRDGKSVLPLVRVFGLSMGIASLMAFYFISTTNLLMLTVTWLIPTGMWLLTTIIKDREKITFGLAIVVPVFLVALGFFADYKELLMPIFWGGNSQIAEVEPLNLYDAFKTYGLACFVALGALWYFRKKDALLIIWTVVLVAAAIGQRRWGYYAIVPISLLAAAFTVQIGTWVQKSVRYAVVGIVVLFLLLTNIQNTVAIATMSNQMTADWYVSLTWMKQNTPTYSYDMSTKKPYGILVWWDYGHWVVRIAQRAPLESPTHDAVYVAQFLASATEEDANKWLQGLNVPYVILDKTTLRYKWESVLVRAEKKQYVKLEDTFAYTLWNNQATTWKLIHERGDVKIYEHIPQRLLP